MGATTKPTVREVLGGMGLNNTVSVADVPKNSRLSMIPISNRPPMTAEMPLGTRVLICGDPKTGKSTMAATARKPIILDFENRLRYVEGNRVSPLFLPEDVDRALLKYPFNVTLGEVKKGERFDFLLDWFREMAIALREDAGQTYETVVVDTLDSFLDLLVQQWTYDNGPSKDLRQDYKFVYDRLMPALEAFTDRLPIDRIFVCHTEGTEAVRWLALPKYVKQWITSHVEIIGMVYTPRAGEANRFYMANKPGWPTAKTLTLLPEECPTTMDAIYAVWRKENPEKFQPEFERFALAEAD